MADLSRPGIDARDDSIAPHLVLVHDHHAEGWNDLLAPAEQVDIRPDVKEITSLRVRESRFRTSKAMPSEFLLVQVDMFVDAPVSVLVADALADQLFRSVVCGSRRKAVRSLDGPLDERL